MSVYRRDTAKNLLVAFKTDKLFVDAVAKELKEGRVSAPLAEKSIIQYYVSEYKLLDRLRQDSSIFGV